jgi:hypothetical protein
MVEAAPTGGQWWCPPEFAAICGNDTHLYDARAAAVCPACGNPDRLMVGRCLSPDILHPRLKRALRAPTKEKA